MVKKANLPSSKVVRKKKTKVKAVTVFSQDFQQKNRLIRKVCSTLLYTVSVLLLFTILIFAWTTIIVIIGLSRMIFLEPETSPFTDNQNMFYTIAGTFVVVGLFSSWKTWRSWFSPQWWWSFWWAIFPLMYCGLCVVLLRYL